MLDSILDLSFYNYSSYKLYGCYICYVYNVLKHNGVKISKAQKTIKNYVCFRAKANKTFSNSPLKLISCDAKSVLKGNSQISPKEI